MIIIYERMRRFNTLFLLALLSAAGAMAQDTGTGFVGKGYYRVKNLATNRYIYVTDNKDYYDKSTDTEDFQAIELWKENNMISNPASVIYIYQNPQNANEYDLEAQGTSVKAFTGLWVNVTRLSNGTYKVSASRKGVTKTLSDIRTSSMNKGRLGTTQSGNYQKWIVDLIKTDHATNFFGIKPDATMQVNGKYYQPFYAGFPFKVSSPNMHVYYISKVSGNDAIMKEITGEVPAKTPVIIECSSTEPTNNRLELLISSSATISGNKLGGTYFCRGDRPKESTAAYKAFDASTMRVFTIADGKLVLTNNDSNRLSKINVIDYVAETVTPTECIPANTSYLKVDSNTPAVLNIRIDGSGIEDIIADSNDTSVEGVYTLSGTQLRSTNDLKGLPAGLYIVGGVKVAIK